MSYFILMGRRIPKQAITGFKFQNETDNIRPFLSIRIRGKEEIIPFKDKKEIQSVKAHLCSIHSMKKQSRLSEKSLTCLYRTNQKSRN